MEWALLPDKTLLLRLNEFSSGATDALKDALRQGLDLDAERVILDMRGNPGGLVSEAKGVASQFLEPGSVLYQHQERGEVAQDVMLEEESGLARDLPLVVLIDRSSASAAEIVAASLRDNDRAEVIGVQTFGTATVVTSFDLDDGSIAAIGTALWKSPSGEFARDAGIEPTIFVEMPPGVDPLEFESGSTLTQEAIAAHQDLQLEAAIAELREKAPSPSYVQ